MEKNKRPEVYDCKFCKIQSETVGVVQKEEHFYKYDLSTKQWIDFHGDDSVGSQELFCLNCNKRIKDLELD
jgi:hypothetical protein